MWRGHPIWQTWAVFSPIWDVCFDVGVCLESFDETVIVRKPRFCTGVVPWLEAPLAGRRSLPMTKSLHWAVVSKSLTSKLGNFFQLRSGLLASSSHTNNFWGSQILSCSFPGSGFLPWLRSFQSSSAAGIAVCAGIWCGELGATNSADELQRHQQSGRRPATCKDFKKQIGSQSVCVGGIDWVGTTHRTHRSISISDRVSLAWASALTNTQHRYLTYYAIYC